MAKPRKTIFDSKAENEIFDAIAGSWEPNYRVYPHLPYTNAIELDETKMLSEEIKYLHYANIDFVLTNKSGTPLLAVEFDGLCGGVSRAGKYFAETNTSRYPSRLRMMQSKVRVANEANFPFLVVSYDEKLKVNDELNLLVLHGIIGSFIASQNVIPRVQELMEQYADRLLELSSEEQDNEIQDMVIAAEIDAEMEFNPIVSSGVALSTRVQELEPYSQWGYGYVFDPARPPNCTAGLPGFDIEAFKRWDKSVVRVGCEFTVELRSGPFTRTVWLRNYEGAGLTPFQFLAELAELVTMQAVLDSLSGAAAAV